MAVNTEQLKSCHVATQGVLGSALSELAICLVTFGQNTAFGKAIVTGCMANTSGVAQRGLAGLPAWVSSGLTAGSHNSLPSSAALSNQGIFPPSLLPSLLLFLPLLFIAVRLISAHRLER